MKKALNICCVLGVVIVLLTHSRQALSQSQGNQHTKVIDQIFAQYDNPDSPGASVAIVHKGEVVFKKGYGMANLEYGIPNSPSTIFHVASVSKQFTIFSVLLLAYENKLSLDDDIRKFIPEMHDFDETITLRHLAAHTSGIRDQWALLALAGWRFDDVITRKHILDLAFQQRDLNFKPGDQYLYCNTGFTLLAEVVSRVSGQPFPQFTKERIFEPLGMTNTQFYDDHEKIVKNRAYSYYPTRNGLKKKVLSFANVGATSLFTTVEDLSRWAINFQSPKVGNFEILETMKTPTVLNNGDTLGIALGQFIEIYKGLKQIHHGGSDAGYRSYIGRFPDQEIAIVTLGNTSAFNSRAMALRIADVYLRSYQSKPAAKEKRNYSFVDLSTSELEKFTGHFWNVEENYSRQILVKGDSLRYSRGNTVSTLAPISATAFKMVNINTDLIIQFQNNEDMTIVVDNGSPSRFVKYDPADYSERDLRDFTGDFYSEELSATYRVHLKEGKLVAKHLRVEEVVFQPIMNDLFLGNHRYFNKIKYIRDAEGSIKGIRVSGNRVKNLWFEKL